MKRFMYIALSAVAIELIVAPLRGYVSFVVSGVAGYLFFAVASLLWTRKEKIGCIALALLIGWGVVQLPIRMIFWNDTLVSLPEAMMHPLGILTGCGLVLAKPKERFFLLLSAIVLCALFVTQYRSWLHYLDFGSVSGRVKEVVSHPLILQDERNNAVSLTDFNGKYLVLDFWNAACGACIKSFPDLQSLHEKWECSSNCCVGSVFCRISKRGETIRTGVDIVTRRGFTFPIYSVDSTDPSLQLIGVNVFPTVLIFNPAGWLIFRGNLEKAEDCLKDLGLKP